MNLNSIIIYINIVIGLSALFMGVWIITRSKGKFKISLIFMFAALFIFVLKETLKILDVFISTNLEVIRNIENTLIILLVLVAGLFMKSIINDTHKHSKKKRKSK